jgi:hypothetical protein
MIIAGAASAAGGGFAGAVVWVFWHAEIAMTIVSKKPMRQYFLMVSSRAYRIQPGVDP